MKLKKEIVEHLLQREILLEQLKNLLLDSITVGVAKKVLKEVILLNNFIDEFKRDALCLYNQHKISGSEYLEIKKNIYYIECATYREINGKNSEVLLDVSIHDFMIYEPYNKVNRFIKEYSKEPKTILCSFE